MAGNLWDWFIAYKILLSAACLPGTQNVIADFLNRIFVADQEWELHDSVINHIFSFWGTPTRDLFASHDNRNAARPAQEGVLVSTLKVMSSSSAGQTRSAMPSPLSYCSCESSTTGILNLFLSEPPPCYKNSTAHLCHNSCFFFEYYPYACSTVGMLASLRC